MIAPSVIGGKIHQAAFDINVETQLAPSLMPGTVVVLDNLFTHQSPKETKILKDNGNWLLFMPAYSPNLNQIKMAFSNLKAHFRRMAHRSYGSHIQALGDISGLLSTDKWRNFFTAKDTRQINCKPL